MVNDYVIKCFLKSLASYQLYLGTYGLLNILKVLNSLQVPNTLKYGAFGAVFLRSRQIVAIRWATSHFKK
jgi:hypothetical protein